MKIDKLILAGGTGFLGQAIIEKFSNSVKEIIVFTRGASHQEKNIRYINWDGKTMGTWSKEIDGSDVLINLTGKSVDCRYNEKNKSEIISSRVNATNILGKAISDSMDPPKVWLNSASATIYRDSEDIDMDENGETGTGFSVDVCKKWEAAFNEAKTPQTRKIALRISMVLGKSGGVLPVMKKLVNAGLGGKMGSGKQFVSWIHEEDFLKAILWLIENEKAAGAYNLAAPQPVTNSDFMQLIRKSLGKKFGIPAAKWMLEIGAVFLRTETELILKSRKVVPKRLVDEGFVFSYSNMEKALKDLLK
jgi:uncharacterized protein